MSSDVCQMSAAGTLWGFRDMGTQWNVLGVDLTPNSRTTIYYVVGDDTAESQEYMFQVPPAPGSTDEIEILACERYPPLASVTRYPFLGYLCSFSHPKYL